MGYIGNKPPQETIPANDSVTEAMLKDNAVTSAKIAATTIVDADINASAAISNSKLETDPTNASNLSSGSVPLAQLGNAPATDLTPLESDIALLGFKVASNGSLGKYDLVDQTIDAFEDASGVDASASTDEVRNASNYYSGGLSSNDAFAYTGSNQTWTAPTGFSSVTVRLWGAGGASGPHGNNMAGGGGGFVKGVLNVTAGNTYDITVGGGGTASGGSAAFGGGGQGGQHVGGGGGRSAIRTNGGSDDLVTAGSGGGGGETGNGGGGGGTTGLSGTGYLSQGDGGSQSSGGSGGNQGSQYTGGSGDSSSLNYSGGGGSGYYGGGSGGNRNNVHYGGGGGGSSYITGLASSETNAQGGTGSDATVGTGAGQSDTQWVSGVGNSGTGSDGAGQPGRVVISYESYNDMTLVSNATTADSTPTTGDIVMTYTNGAGTATVNTDLKAYVSRDNGTTYTQATLSSEGTTGGHTILTAHNVDISSQPSGTSMRYKIETLNQSASKETRIQAVSLGWS